MGVSGSPFPIPEDNISVLILKTGTPSKKPTMPLQEFLYTLREPRMESNTARKATVAKAAVSV
jgi:hypothetical protein